MLFVVELPDPITGRWAYFKTVDAEDMKRLRKAFRQSGQVYRATRKTL
jgi:hypothetical protein